MLFGIQKKCESNAPKCSFNRSRVYDADFSMRTECVLATREKASVQQKEEKSQRFVCLCIQRNLAHLNKQIISLDAGACVCVCVFMFCLLQRSVRQLILSQPLIRL